MRSTHSTKFFPGVSKYYGPADGKSRPRKYQRALKAISSALLATEYKVEVEGKDKLPTSGPQVFTFNHPTVIDPALALNLVEQDMRTVVNVDMFKSPVSAKIMEWAGGYPVNRANPSPVTKSHPIEVLKSGVSLGVFPEGGNAPEEREGRIGAFKKGPAYCAIHGGAENISPTVFDFQPSSPQSGDKLRAALVGGAGVALGLAGSLAGGTVGAVTRVAAGVLAGATLGGTLGRKFAGEGAWFNPTPPMIGNLAGGLAGAALMGATSFLLGDNVGAAFNGLASGVALYGLTRATQKRSTVKVLVGEPIPVAPYRDKANPVKDLTEDLHRQMGEMKSQLSGVPYDDEAPKIFAKGRYANH